jgi:tyrosinase
MSSTPPARPPEMVAASDRPIDLVGQPASVELAVPEITKSQLESAVEEPDVRHVYLNVEDLEAERNPGVVYGVFLNIPSPDPDASPERYHVGNLAPFGIELMNDPDREHEGVPGLRHTFDITSLVNELRQAGKWDSSRVNVIFEVIPPLPPPGEEPETAAMMASEQEAAAAAPLRVGRVSLFVS